MKRPTWTWTTVVLTLLLPGTAFPWGDGGHEMVAAIAYPRLNGRAKAEVDRLLNLSIVPPGLPAAPIAEARFMHASHWPDDVKSLLSATREEHYADFPFSADGTKLPKNLPKKVNALRALRQYVKTLQTSPNDADKAMALRMVIHLVGDIHQPLHCSTRVSQAHPKGDEGGNLFFVKVPDGQGHLHEVKLHSYWDGGLDAFPKEGPNFTPPPDAEIPPAVNDAVAGNPATAPQVSAGGPFDYQGWADESSALAVSTAYDTLIPGGGASPTYRMNGVTTARQRVAWAGYRLAALLNAIWGP